MELAKQREKRRKHVTKSKLKREKCGSKRSIKLRYKILPQEIEKSLVDKSIAKKLNDRVTLF